MALATRNLYLVLKARDEASRVVRGFGRELSRAGRLAQAENMRNAASLATQRAAYLESIGAAAVDIDQQKQLAKQLTAQAQALERAHRRAVRFANALQTVSSTVVTMGSGLAIAGAAGLFFLGSSIKVAQDYEAQVRKTATQVDNFTASLTELSDVGLRVAENIAVPFEDIQPALYNILSSTNANLAQAEILLTSFAKTAVAGQVSIEDAAKGTIPILNAFNIPLEDVNRILDIQFQLVRKGVGTYGEFSSVFGRVVPSATRAGQTFEEVAAMLAYLTRNGLSAAMASSSAARALDALSHPTAVQNMENMGIAVRDVAGNMLPLEKILGGLRDKLDALPHADRVAALVEVFKGAGGTIQARRFLEQVLLRPGELEEFIGYLNDMKESSGAFQNAYETMAASVASQSELLRNKWKVLQETVGRIVMPMYLKLIIVLQKVVDWFNKLSPAAQKAIVIGILIASAFGVFAGILLVVIGLLAGVAASIVTAGVGFFYLLGAILGLVGGLATLTAGFAILYAKSEGFRDLLKTIYDGVMRLWNEAVVPAAQEIRKAFDEQVRPALQRFWDFMETKVIPVAKDFYGMLIEKVVPAAKEVANFFKGEVVAAFKLVVNVIDQYVIPTLTWLVGYYERHKAAIDKIVTALIWLAKVFLIMALAGAAAFAIVFGGPIIAIIAAVGAAITILGMVIVWLVERGTELVNWFKSLGDKAGEASDKVESKWEGLKTKVSDIWTGIKDWINAKWEDIKGIFNNAMDFLDAKWDAFWNGRIGRLLIATWELIKSVIRLGWTAVQFLFAWGGEFVSRAWNLVWTEVKDTVSRYWNSIILYLTGKWHELKAVAVDIWDSFTTFFDLIWDRIGGKVTSTWEGIKNFVTSKWSEIRDAAEQIWETVVQTVTGKVEAVRETVSSKIQAIRDFFSNARSWLREAGENLINGLLDGLTNKIDQAKAKIDEFAQWIRDHFPHSPAKIGPLSGRGGMFYAGQNLIKQLAQGIDSARASLAVPLAGSALSARQELLSAPGTGGFGRQVNQHITVNTQEVNPTRQSAELGFLLAGRS